MGIKDSVPAACSVKNANASANCPISHSFVNQNGFASRKSATSVFSFRLDEHARKQKEFNMKIEEKIKAKEDEKNNLQAKSKTFFLGSSMVAQDGVYIEDKNCINENIVSEKSNVEELILDVIVTNEEKLSEAKVAPTGEAKSDDLKRSKIKFDGSKPSMESGAIAEDCPKTKKVVKEKQVGKGTTSSVRNQKPNLSQSLMLDYLEFFHFINDYENLDILVV